jgi:hypothetical protein
VVGGRLDGLLVGGRLVVGGRLDGLLVGGRLVVVDADEVFRSDGVPDFVTDDVGSPGVVDAGGVAETVEVD